MAFPFYHQPDAMDCGPTCLRIISKHYGRTVSLKKLRRLSEANRQGTSLKSIADAAENLGFRSLGVKIDFITLLDEVPLPCIVHWRQNHFVVIYKIKWGHVYVSDPAQGLIKYTIQDFIENWIGNGAVETTEGGVVLILEPTPRLQITEGDDMETKRGFRFLFRYLFQYKKFIIQLALGLLIGSLLQLIFPFLTQSIVDIGIRNRDINFIYLVLIAQLFLFLGRTAVNIIRRWILLHLSTRINISMISDFFIKLMNLPIAYFDTKLTGDIMQRINDHQRIERLLTSTTLNTLFSFFNLIVFGAVLAWYSFIIFAIFLGGSILYFLWVMIFLKRRKALDYKRFSKISDVQSKVIEIINGMQEIKLHNAEKQKRWSWEYLQARLFKISIKRLRLEQTQSSGSSFINELKNILIIFISAKLVIEGTITLGMMMAISYIIGQLNSPIRQLIGFVYSVQDANIALERLSEIHNREDEEPVGKQMVNEIPEDEDITLTMVSYRYPGSNEEVIKKLSMIIPAKKTTAVVGTSGSGKTTLMKLLLKFYKPSNGDIKIGNTSLNLLSQKAMRGTTGVVMQEGYIFNDTIANNIAIGEDIIDKSKLKNAVELSNIGNFIKKLPLGFNTKIGMEGVGISTGQKQRFLIARAIYKNPQILFFDEATSALDANNERIIMENLNLFLKGKTAIIIAHRLSTVKNADQIVVLENGKIIEKGVHDDLIKHRGRYFDLIKNQLELGN